MRAKPEDRARALNNALSQAAQRGHTAAALYLMDCGADLRASREGALALAVWNDCLDTVEALIDRGADVRDCALIHRVLETSVRENKLEMARLLLDRGVPPQESNSYPLRMALGLKLPAMARLLVERGADLSELLPEEREALEQLLKEPV